MPSRDPLRREREREREMGDYIGDCNIRVVGSFKGFCVVCRISEASKRKKIRLI